MCWPNTTPIGIIPMASVMATPAGARRQGRTMVARPRPTRLPGSTDPKIGELGVGAGNITDTTTTTVGDVTTTVITYSSGLTATIVRTANRTGGQRDGSVTIVTKDTLCMSTAGCTGVTQVIASAKGSIRSGGDERGLQARTGRISWRELVAP